MGEHSQGFAKIHENLGEVLQGFSSLWERICETLGEDLQGFMLDYGRGFARIHARLWERICKELQDFMRRFARILGTLAEDLQ